MWCPKDTFDVEVGTELTWTFNLLFAHGPSNQLISGMKADVADRSAPPPTPPTHPPVWTKNLLEDVRMLTIHVGHSSVVDADQRIYPRPRSRLPRSTNPPRFAASTSLASWPLPRTNKNKTKQTFGKLGRNSAPELPSRTPAGTCRPFPNPFLFPRQRLQWREGER